MSRQFSPNEQMESRKNDDRAWQDGRLQVECGEVYVNRQHSKLGGGCCMESCNTIPYLIAVWIRTSGKIRNPGGIARQLERGGF